MTDTIEVRKPPRIKNSDFGVAEFRRTIWQVELQPSQTMDDLSNPLIWRDVLGKQKPGDTIEAWKPDTSQLAEFAIFEISPNFIRLGKFKSAEPEQVIEPDGPLKLKWNFGAKSYDVVRERDGYKMAGPFQTKISAVEWINDNMAKMAA